MEVQISKNKIVRSFLMGRDKKRQLYRLYKKINNKRWRQSKKLFREYKTSPTNSEYHVPLDEGFKVINNSQTGAAIAETSLDVLASKNILAKKKEYKGKNFLITGNLNREDLQKNQIYLDFALNEHLLIEISRYLDEVPILSAIDVWYSPQVKTESFSGSQLFHCDWVAESQVKIFVYSTAVAIDDGPLTLINAKQSAVLRKKIGYSYNERVPDQLAEEFISKSDFIQCTGMKGTMVLCDTSKCFHFGSRVKQEGQPRIVTVFQYLRPSAIGIENPFFRNLPFKNLDQSKLSQLQKFVISGEC